MKKLYKQKREQGFTIIEVMIVLAIAAVILLIVLLAVPALQRNSRNTQRANDAGQIAAAVNACLANQNGSPANCGSVGVNNVDLDGTAAALTKTGQLTAVSFVNANGGSAAVGTGTTSSAVVGFNSKCNVNAVTTPANPKQFVVTWQNESTGVPINRCVDG